MRNNIFLLTILSIFITGCTVQTKNLSSGDFSFIKKEEKKFYELKRPEVSQDLKEFIKKVVVALSNKDLQTLNTKFINPKVGFYNLSKVDGITSFSHQKEIYNVIDSEVEEISELMNYISKDAINYVIIEQDLKFNCSPNDDAYYGWNGEGLYLSPITSDYLSKMITTLDEKQKTKYSEEEIKIAQFVEGESYKIILTPDIVFYVNKIDKKWYITLFDRITTDCSSPKEIENNTK
ncbi:hypothetical protein GCM10012288_00640 [Malaciobacter pacificus]|uniref:Uncharacterized protein n=1 Tax=Malaciobacter pacificus TaxID=1080223 RepID=A0A5C2H3M2_9BACT|nr:hypothetical protein [Malaciobacter pacificus]QEP33323.1 hypothetical protein APAC_0153 [Malaciobacter pacificus]GGD30453.1 hypothetical protein GCM10012288_00640 [Malaciobacter pacificus]